MDELKGFPYPFKEDIYRYSNNSTLLGQPNCIELTSNYRKEIHLKRNLLIKHPERCYQSLPHTIPSQWEAMSLITNHLITYFPEKFSLVKDGNNWTFRNYPLNEEYCFTFGDNKSLAMEPLDFIGRHVQEDIIIMMQRDGDLYLDAGQLCFPANWSLAFNLGMNFKEIHQPIPGFKEEGLDNRILQFLLRLEDGAPWGRKNWSLMAGSRLDTSLETFDAWGKDRRKVTFENAGELVRLRVEVQKLFRLPRSGSILFTIHTHLLPLEKFVLNEEWLVQFTRILEELPPHITDYKGLALYKNTVLDYLRARLKEKGIK
ncbi:heme-dependent oxidative N-demethylase family protein [Sutcliffiella halmapala]|uniref:heme-dependent oxidative N-demethylase family protein n=1 Tax=Sutcliffiella halmapala TaxID=79882 RepID=UPI001F34EA1E|nr:DUF3445 domain-containing protein [Sutcliffiella halmapala]